MMLRKIVGKIFLSWFPCNEKVFLFFCSWIQKYCIFIARDCCCLIVLSVILAAVVFSFHTCVMDCGWPISSNVFRKMMTYLPVTKHPPVYAFRSEAATNFKMLQFTCTRLFRRSCAHFEGILPNKNRPAARLHACGSVIYNASVLACKIMSEAWNLTTSFEYFSM